MGSENSWNLTLFSAGPLYSHLQSQGIEFIQFAFRWMNCLLMRELSLKNTIRMWDSYQVGCAACGRILTVFAGADDFEGRRKGRMGFRSFICMFVLRFW